MCFLYTAFEMVMMFYDDSVSNSPYPGTCDDYGGS